MKLFSKNLFLKIPLFISVMVFLFNCAAVEQLTQPTAKTTPSAGPTIEQAQKEEYMGPKARIAVIRFEDRSAKGKITGAIGDGMAEMLSNALFATNRFIVLERQYITDIIQEQDFGASGRVRQETAARIGEIEGADLLIRGVITEFEPGSAGAGAAGGATPGVSILGGFLGIRKSHVAMIITGIDVRTSRRVFSEQVEGKATDIAGLVGAGGGGLAGVFAGFSKTPMEKAIRIAIEEAVRMIVTKTPSHYFRVQDIPQSPVTIVSSPTDPEKTTQQTIPPTQTKPSTPPPQSTSAIQETSQTGSTPEHRIVFVKWSIATLREGPGTDFRSIKDVKKGTPLVILEEKDQWIRVRLEDGMEGWIGKATISEKP